MKESENKENTNEEPLIDKDTNQEKIDVIDTKKDEEKPVDQLEVGKQEEESEEDSNKLLQDKLLSKKYSKDDAPEVKEDEGIACPAAERYTYDPYLESNIFNRFIFYWAFSILRMAKKYRLKVTDLGTPAPSNNARIFAKNLHRIWDDLGYKNYQNYALFRTVVRSNACPLALVMLLSGMQAGLDYFSVIITKQFIDYFNTTDTKNDSSFTIDAPLWVLGCMFLGTQIIIAFLGLHTQMIQSNFGNRAGYELNTFIYNKILNYAPSGFTQRANHGEIINFIQIDSMRLSFLVAIAPNAFVAPLMIIAYIYLLFDFFGLTFLSGLAILLTFMVMNYFIAKAFRRRQKRMMGKKDICMKVTTETLENIKILKLYNWENEFKRKILESRSVEMDYTAKRYVMTNLNQAVNWLCPTLVSIVTIGIYQLFHDTFNISTMLIGLSIFSKLQNPVRMLPSVINNILETTVSLKRIEDFLKQPDINRDVIHKGPYDENGEYAIKISGGNFSWGVKQKKKQSRWFVPGKKGKKGPPGGGPPGGFPGPSEGGEGFPPRPGFKPKGKEGEDNKNEIITNSDSQRTTVRMGDPNEKEPEKIDPNNQGNEEGKEIERDGCKIQVPIPKGVDYDLTLKNINLEVKPGELVAIVGEVGCGKSSLLQALINELILLNPKECDGVHINGRVGYAAQIPWIQNDTIRNNILFSKPFDEEKYNNVLKLCQLNEDLETFEGKDLTEIGEKGVNLSGGQKVRISLARMIYNEPDIYLFDDPISALDANVGKKIMKYCIVNHLKGKTRVVVTHALSYLKYMDRIIYMKSGRIEWTGTYQGVQEQPFYSELAKTIGFSKAKSGDVNESSLDNKDDKKIKKKEDEKIVKLVTEEEQSRGGIKYTVYLDYFRYMGGICYIITVVIIMGLWQANKGGSDLWLAYWSQEKNQNKSKEEPKYKWIFFSIFSGLGLLSVFFMFLRIIMLTKGVIRLGRTVHRDMVERLIKAPINLFHETVPRGQIYNRLSKDLDHMNFSMWSLGDLLTSLLSVIGSFVLCGIYDKYSLLYMPIVFIVGYYVTKFFLSGSRPLTRIASISRSPILNVISETLPGNPTIRAFGEENFYKEKYFDKINNSLNINLITRGANVWFQEQFKFVSIIYLTYLVLRTILDEENVTAQSCSIVFTYSVLLQEYLGSIFNRCAFLENDMVSMERCCKYMHIVQEEPSYIPEVDDKLKEEHWPQNGEIEFKDFSVRYRPGTEIVLKKINFHIQPGEKVGICGRTGSGKSTICLCLFRILEATEGQIFIDNTDIAKIGLDLLRSNLTIIPQDPCLMEGTLKYNIDPFNQSKNEEIIQILKDIGFDYTEPDDKIMDKMIEAGGSNLSVGQKQLVCIARALLRKSKIVVMDEATANIDMNTEQIIQKALNLVLENSTVLTVAHRIKTIINYDKILVLDAGEVKEFDTPSNLIKDENSLFHELYTKSTL
jgi:ABC-type multidrug transport system fused ATPase/permease subunit